MKNSVRKATLVVFPFLLAAASPPLCPWLNPAPPQNPLGQDLGNEFTCTKAGLDRFDENFSAYRIAWANDVGTFLYIEALSAKMQAECEARFHDAFNACVAGVGKDNPTSPTTTTDAEGNVVNGTVKQILGPTAALGINAFYSDFPDDSFDTFSTSLDNEAAYEGGLACIRGLLPSNVIVGAGSGGYVSIKADTPVTDSNGNITHALNVTFKDTPQGVSVTQNFLVSNNGEGRSTGLAVSDGSDLEPEFTLDNNCSGDIGAGSSCGFSISFLPTEIKTYTGGTMSVTNQRRVEGKTINETFVLVFSATSVPAVTNLVLEPVTDVIAQDYEIFPETGTIGFGTLTTGTFQSQSVRVRNIGNVTASNIFVSKTGASFSKTSDCEGSLNPGSSCNVSVKFEPTSDVTYSGNVKVARTEQGVVKETLTITVSGRGYVPPPPPLPPPPDPNQPPPPPANGREQAGQLCNNISYTQDKLACLAIVGPAYYFDPDAVTLCGNISYTQDKLSCLTAIANKYFDPEAFAICRDISYTADKMNCLNAIANKYYDNFETDVCRSISYTADKISCLSTTGRLDPRDNDSGVQAAGQWCLARAPYSEQARCLNGTRFSQHFDVDALSVCEILQPQALAIDCVIAISDRYYSYDGSDVSYCVKLPTDLDVKNCLAYSGYHY